MKVGILTSGGDCPGMNACVCQLIKESEKIGCECYVIKKGFQGLIDGLIEPAKSIDYNHISHLGGSVIKCYRSPYFVTDEGYEKALDTIKTSNIDVFVAIGGNGTLKGCQKLARSGCNIIFVPATIDNDLFYTEKTLGFDSALSSCTEALDKIMQTMQSADRGSVVEVMGRHCADLAENCALAVDADYVISSANPYSYEKLKEVLKSKTDGFMIVVQENILNVFELAKNLQNDLDIDVRANILGYMQRGGAPSVFDRIFAKNLATACVECLKKKNFSVALGISMGEITETHLSLADI